MRRITLRQASQQDWPAIQRLHQEHQAAQGTNYELPNLFGPAIAIALVGVEDGGAIRNCIYVETIAELRFVGCDPKATAFGRREIDGLSYVLKLQGFRWLECFVPRTLKKMIQKPLRRAGFTCVDRELAHFAKDLRGKNDPKSPATLRSDRSTCAPFIKERRMKPNGNTNIHRRLG